MQIGDTTCESISKTAQSSASCSDLRASAASGYLCTFPRWVPISEEAQTSSSWRFDAYAGGKRGLACYLARTWIRTLKLRPHSGSETATLGFNLHCCGFRTGLAKFQVSVAIESTAKLSRIHVGAHKLFSCVLP